MDLQIFRNKGELWTTSIAVADNFKKEHKNILQAIKNLECSKEFNRLNFKPIYFMDKYNRKQPACNISRDGFIGV